MLLFSLTNIYKAQVIKRPSKSIKTPYVADILLVNNTNTNNNNEYLCHTPSLGCCGLVDKSSYIYVSDNRENNKIKTDFRAEVALYEEINNIMKNKKNENMSVLVGVNPKLGENIAEYCLKNELIKDLQIKKYKREQKVGISRFDFVGKTKENILFILEVKTVPLANYVDMENKDLKNKLKNKELDVNEYNFDEKVAYFPDGYRKKKGDVVSPRALKHIEELEKIKKEYGKEIRTILLYVIQRNDVSKFTTSIIDPTYKKAVKKAFDNGVEIKTIQVKWNYNEDKKEMFCEFIRNDLPIDL